MGQDLKRDGINLVRSIYRANKAKNKVEYLEQDLIKLQSAISNKIYDQSLIIGTTTLTFW